MTYEQVVRDIYKIAGMLEMLTCMQDRSITSGMVAELVDAVDKLELIGAELVSKDFNSLSDKYECLIKKHACLIEEYDNLRLKMEVNAHEESERAFEGII